MMTEYEVLSASEDLKVITNALTDTMIERRLSLQTMLTGIHAFLLALVASGYAESTEIADELYPMVDYFDTPPEEPAASLAA